MPYYPSDLQSIVGLYYSFDYGKTLEPLSISTFTYLGYCNGGYYCGNQTDLYDSSIHPC